MIGLSNFDCMSTALLYMRRWLPILTLAACSGCWAASSRAGWTVADFDGDKHLDLAVTKSEARGASYVYWLELDLSSKREIDAAPDRPDLPGLISPAFGLHLTPRDVDGDRDLDIVVTAGFARQPVAVWINDGKGRFVEGDLTAYSAWIGLEDSSSLCPHSRPEAERRIFNQNRRPRFGLEARRSRAGTELRSSVLPSGQAELPISSSPFDPSSARAPPALSLLNN